MRWRAYLSILRIRLIGGLQYRAQAFAGVAINSFWGIILVTILMLFYKYGYRQHVGMTLAQGVTYIWFAQGFISLVPIQMDTEIYQRITSGDFAYELCRPLDVYAHWFTRIAAIRISGTLLKSWLTFLIAILLPAPFGILPPVSVQALVATLVLLGGALLLSCALTNLMNISLLRVELGPGLNSLIVSMVVIFSGMLVPLTIFPDWLQPVLRALPFAGMIDFPSSLYTGLIPVQQVWGLLGRQIFWIVALVLLGRWRMQKALRRTVIQGG